MNDAKINEVKELNDAFYELFGALHENAAHLTTKQVDYMGAKLHELYKGEYAKIVHSLELENAREAFTHSERWALLAPKVRRIRLFRRRDLGKFKFSHENRAASAILDELEAETDAFFELAEKALEKTAAASKQPPAPAVPDNGDKKPSSKRDRSATSSKKSPITGKGETTNANKE